MRRALFDDAAIKRYAEQALADLAPGKRMALVAMASIDGGVELRYAYRAGDTWTLGGVLRRNADDTLEGGIQVKWSI